MKTKRFLLFEISEPLGGMNDFIGDFNTEKDAHIAADNLVRIDKRETVFQLLDLNKFSTSHKPFDINKEVKKC